MEAMTCGGTILPMEVLLNCNRNNRSIIESPHLGEYSTPMKMHLGKEDEQQHPGKALLLSCVNKIRGASSLANEFCFYFFF